MGAHTRAQKVPRGGGGQAHTSAVGGARQRRRVEGGGYQLRPECAQRLRGGSGGGDAGGGVQGDGGDSGAHVRSGPRLHRVRALCDRQLRPCEDTAPGLWSVSRLDGARVLPPEDRRDLQGLHFLKAGQLGRRLRCLHLLHGVRGAAGQTGDDLSLTRGNPVQRPALHGLRNFRKSGLWRGGSGGAGGCVWHLQGQCGQAPRPQPGHRQLFLPLCGKVQQAGERDGGVAEKRRGRGRGAAVRDCQAGH
mmetsp:Transcript_13941/g.30769  ORF Transcript_13941/g.30769 Transcript_13941/m.30769 type:complete len:248 (+) Transcript_13941:3676-4419(+)